MNIFRIIVHLCLVCLLGLGMGSCVFSPAFLSWNAAAIDREEGLTAEARTRRARLLAYVNGEDDYFIGEFSAYTPAVEETDDTPLIMASGRSVYEGAIACPRYYPFGTRIEIEDYGIFTCEDRMAVRYRYEDHFDVLMFDIDEALRFGRREMRYRVIHLPVETDEYLIARLVQDELSR